MTNTGVDGSTFIFWPKCYKDGEEVKRRMVLIMDPVETLKNICFDTLIKEGIDRNSVKDLPIPRNITEQFIEYADGSNVVNRLYQDNYKSVI